MAGIQTYDDQNCDTNLVRFVCFDRPEFRTGQFVIFRCPSGRRFFASVAGPNRNHNRDALGALSSAAINQAEYVYEGRMERDVVLRPFYAYEALLAGEIVSDGDNAYVSSARLRPEIFSLVFPANEKEVVRYLKLPETTPAAQIGALIDAPVPVCVSRWVFNSHILLAGATGSGKSNCVANLLLASTNLGGCNIIFDHKPDFQHAHEPNDAASSEAFFQALPDVHYWHIGEARPSNIQERPIYVPAHMLDPAMLAATICYARGESNQMEELEALIEHYISSRTNEDGQEPQWSIEDFQDWLGEANLKGLKIYEATLNAIKRRVIGRSGSRIPGWIKNGAASSAPQTLFGSASRKSPKARFDIADLIAPGRTIVVRIGGGAENGRDYGLLLSYILGRIDARVAQGGCPRITVAIDEAQDIFNAGEAFKAVAEAMLDRQIRKGRSKGIGYIIGVQSAEAVPDTIMNNLNTRIVLRHNGSTMLRTALPRATDEQREMTNTFSPGEALVKMNGSTAIVHAKMRQSPFKLTKDDAGA